jgi:hypothetical protein
MRNKGAYRSFAPAVTEIDCISQANHFIDCDINATLHNTAIHHLRGK